MIINTAQKTKFSIKDLFSKYDQIRSFLRIWTYLLNKFLRENFIFYAVKFTLFTHGLSEAYSELCDVWDVSQFFTKVVNGLQSWSIMLMKARSKMFVTILNMPLTESPEISYIVFVEWAMQSCSIHLLF